jgi:succinate-semialdehyde dehydrogenase / glutarate-semialdehyde dehydrogenase
MSTDCQPLLVGGRWVLPEGKATIDVLNPATEELVGRVGEASAEQVEAALEAARAAQSGWAALPPPARAWHLQRIAEGLAAARHNLATLMTAEQGKPLTESLGEVDKAAETFVFYAEEAKRWPGEIIANDDPAYQSLVLYEPVGVVTAITPWNYPLELITWKVAAALAAGCTIVVKPPELTPLAALAYARCLSDAGLPPGVLNMITGPGPSVGRALVQSPIPAKIAFTGSTATGLAIMQGLRDVKRLALELGGNCPMIVGHGADLDRAVRGAARRAFRNAGQICIAINRIYVVERHYAAFVERLAAAAKTLRLGNGMAGDVDLGPMASAEGRAKVERHVADALANGARCLAGGRRPDGPGFFYPPTVLVDCTADMLVMREESFGPVVGVASVPDLDAAIAAANGLDGGLAAYLDSDDLGEVHHALRRLDFGNVAVNHVDAGIIQAPYGGRKQSGFGVEHGRAGMLDYLQQKHVRLLPGAPRT